MKLSCACLFHTKGDLVLLVRVRENDHWYLAGGKIEPGEMPEQTLCRELQEELALTLQPSDLEYRGSVEGPAYGQPGTVRLICFQTTKEIQPKPSSEVTEADWLGESRFQDFAPAVQILYRAWLEGNF